MNSYQHQILLRFSLFSILRNPAPLENENVPSVSIQYHTQNIYTYQYQHFSPVEQHEINDFLALDHQFVEMATNLFHRL